MRRTGPKNLRGILCCATTSKMPLPRVSLPFLLWLRTRPVEPFISDDNNKAARRFPCPKKSGKLALPLTDLVRSPATREGGHTETVARFGAAQASLSYPNRIELFVVWTIEQLLVLQEGLDKQTVGYVCIGMPMVEVLCLVLSCQSATGTCGPSVDISP